jgi:hypothetical protein
MEHTALPLTAIVPPTAICREMLDSRRAPAFDWTSVSRIMPERTLVRLRESRHRRDIRGDRNVFSSRSAPTN